MAHPDLPPHIQKPGPRPLLLRIIEENIDDLVTGLTVLAFLGVVFLIILGFVGVITLMDWASR